MHVPHAAPPLQNPVPHAPRSALKNLSAPEPPNACRKKSRQTSLRHSPTLCKADSMYVATLSTRAASRGSSCSTCMSGLRIRATCTRPGALQLQFCAPATANRTATSTEVRSSDGRTRSGEVTAPWTEFIPSLTLQGEHTTEVCRHDRYWVRHSVHIPGTHQIMICAITIAPVSRAQARFEAPVGYRRHTHVATCPTPSHASHTGAATSCMQHHGQLQPCDVTARSRRTQSRRRPR